MNNLKQLVKRLFCRHAVEAIGWHRIHPLTKPYGIEIKLRCVKCGDEDVDYLFFPKSEYFIKLHPELEE